MKTYKKMGLFLFILCMMACAKSNIGVNHITLDVKGNNEDQTVSASGVLNVKINAEDTDGIESIRLEIPILNVDLMLEDQVIIEKWQINRNFEVGDIATTGVFEVTMILTDRKGEEYMRDQKFTIK